MSVIDSLVAHIVERFQPEAVILFGSHAYGTPHPWSDVDLLVVVDTPNGEIETALAIADTLPPHAFGVDILVRSRAVINQRKAEGDWFLREITSKGRVLYEEDDGRVGHQG
jgi:predicted nucleotidyltransferase